MRGIVTLQRTINRCRATSHVERAAINTVRVPNDCIAVYQQLGMFVVQHQCVRAGNAFAVTIQRYCFKRQLAVVDEQIAGEAVPPLNDRRSRGSRVSLGRRRNRNIVSGRNGEPIGCGHTILTEQHLDCSCFRLGLRRLLAALACGSLLHIIQSRIQGVELFLANLANVLGIVVHTNHGTIGKVRIVAIGLVLPIAARLIIRYRRNASSNARTILGKEARVIEFVVFIRRQRVTKGFLQVWFRIVIEELLVCVASRNAQMAHMPNRRSTFFRLIDTSHSLYGKADARVRKGDGIVVVYLINNAAG